MQKARPAPLSSALQKGELEAIALAKERGAQLLIDDLRARRAARDQGIEVFGTLRILAEAKQRNLVQSVRPIMEEMQSNGYRFDHILIRRFLDRLREQ
ncbi:MAG: DUF3368 domain-containing protein [Candidatus Binataceae bacterium]